MAVKKGDKVKVEYEGKLESGETFDSTKQEDGTSQPIEFEVGSGKILPAFEENVEGMEEGQEKEFTLKPENAYGERNEEMKKQIPRDQLPQDQEPKEGMALLLNTPQGQQFPAKIIGVDENNITIDLNHPLAGKTLNFNVKVSEVVKAEDKEESNESTENKPEEKASEESPSENSNDSSENSEETSTEENKE